MAEKLRSDIGVKFTVKVRRPRRPAEHRAAFSESDQDHQINTGRPKLQFTGRRSQCARMIKSNQYYPAAAMNHFDGVTRRRQTVTQTRQCRQSQLQVAN